MPFFFYVEMDWYKFNSRKRFGILARARWCFFGCVCERLFGKRSAFGSGGAPVLQKNKINGQPAVYFSGTSSPLKFTCETVTVKHIFIISAFEDADFTDNEGLLSDTNVPVLYGGGAATTKFYNLANGSFCRKNNLRYTAQIKPRRCRGISRLSNWPLRTAWKWKAFRSDKTALMFQRNGKAILSKVLRFHVSWPQPNGKRFFCIVR